VAPVGSGGTRLRFMLWGRPDAATWEYQAITAVHPNDAKKYTIEPFVGGSGDVQVAEKFRLMLSAGGADVPDIIRLNRIQVPEFAEAGVLTDLSEWMKPFTADMIDSARSLAIYKDQYVAVPLQLKSKIWFYCGRQRRGPADHDAVAGHPRSDRRLLHSLGHGHGWLCPGHAAAYRRVPAVPGPVPGWNSCRSDERIVPPYHTR
jgi:hypothetical protein